MALMEGKAIRSLPRVEGKTIRGFPRMEGASKKVARKVLAREKGLKALMSGGTLDGSKSLLMIWCW